MWCGVVGKMYVCVWWECCILVGNVEGVECEAEDPGGGICNGKK